MVFTFLQATAKPQTDSTLVEVVARQLFRSGRPKETDQTLGRFMVTVADFLDPTVYEKGRQFTVTGTITGSMEQAIDAYQYNYPVVTAEAYHLWEPVPQTSRYDYYPYPGYYDPDSPSPPNYQISQAQAGLQNLVVGG